MSIIHCFLLVVISQIFLVYKAESQGYDTKYDDIDLEELLKNDRLRHNYVNCLMGEGPCTPDGQELKVALPDAIQSECSKCSEKQKSGAETVTHFLIDNKPDEWQKLADKYDQDGDYKAKYLKEKEKLITNKGTNDEEE
ncbi:putative odorant-binding protein A10 [Pseudolycoriella hygida]|uniref:Odorant-binding protein A10 n=1 Tax=Pseudolycoriella hygida TaxID=35572 RepID=A0A9Q0N3D8_9DIPT|nr:putative odorant-binding protein A10 [Pseudolycoriella hygida]